MTFSAQVKFDVHVFKYDISVWCFTSFQHNAVCFNVQGLAMHQHIEYLRAMTEDVVFNEE